jgi:Carboxypeptidase regulatory-like domain
VKSFIYICHLSFSICHRRECCSINDKWKMNISNNFTVSAYFMKNMVNKTTGWPLIFLLGLFWPLCAQSVTLLRGHVVDEMGAVIPDARVTLVASGEQQHEAFTNANGEFVIPKVAPGTYNLVVEFKGFQTHIENGINVSPGARPLKIVMKVAAVNETAEVPAEGKGVSVEPDQNLTGIVLDEKMIQEILPDTEEEILELLQALAGGTGNAQIMIDGFTGGRLPPREAIMQVRINQNLFSAEFSGGGVGAGRIEIITRPGNSEWRGNVIFGLRNSALDARNAFALTKPELDQQRYGFNFGGPLIRKRLDFSLNVDWTPTHGSGLVSATTLDGLFTTNVPAPSENRGLSFRAGLFINNKNTLNMTYNYRGSERTNSEFAPGFGGGNFGGVIGGGGLGGAGGGGRGGFGAGASGTSGTGGSLMLPERASNTGSANHSLSFSETFLINARMIHETRLRLQQDTSQTIPVMQAVAVDVLDAFQGGGSTKSSESRTTTIELQDSLTMTFKKHTIKVGFQVEHENVRDLSANNFNGTYTFSTLDQYGRALNGEPVPATQFTINRGEPLLRYSQSEASWYVQDDIRVSQSLTVSLGLRHEFQQHLDDKLNFAPRFNIAWAPFQNRKTVIRAGGGIFFNRLSGGTYANMLRYDNQTQETITIFNPVYINPLPADLSALSSNITTQQSTTRQILDPDLRAPYYINGMFSIEQQLPKALVGTISYSFNRGIHLFRTRNINAPLPETGLRPDPEEGNIYATESSGKSIRHELAFGISRRFSTRFTFFSNYRLAWAMDDSAFPADNYNLKPEWARSSIDRRHSFNMVLMINPPWGIRIIPNLFINSGAPFNITTGLDDNLDGQFNDRPAGIGRNSDLPAALYPLIPRPDRLVSVAGGPTLTLIDYLNTYYPNGLRAEGPGSFNANLGISKTFGFGTRSGQQARTRPGIGDVTVFGGEGVPGGGPGGPGGGFGGGIGGPGGRGGFGGRGGGFDSARFTLRLSASITNVFNHVNFGQYSGTLGSPYLGRPSSAGAPRQFNLNLMFTF